MDRKDEQIKQLGTEVLRVILGSLAGPERERPSPEFPLGGLVHIAGIGQVPVVALRRELAGREG